MKGEFCVDTGRVSVIRLYSYSFNLLLGLPSCLFHSVSPISILCAHLVSHMHATNHVPLICLHLGNLAIFLQYLLKTRNWESSHYYRQWVNCFNNLRSSSATKIILQFNNIFEMSPSWVHLDKRFSSLSFFIDTSGINNLLLLCMFAFTSNQIRIMTSHVYEWRKGTNTFMTHWMCQVTKYSKHCVIYYANKAV
jgi:hypothetical protein